MSTLSLSGLRSRPLASYLAAVGVLKVVAEQADPSARARWHGAAFELRTALSEDELVEFFTAAYRPAPLVAPWNGADQGGFRPGVKGRAAELLAAVSASRSSRLEGYRMIIAQTGAIVASPEWQEKIATDKRAAVLDLRNRLPDDALEFIDAAVALTADGVAYPPLLGTGGNIGRLDLTTNYLERLDRVLCLRPRKTRRGEAATEDWVRELLFGEPASGLADSPGQFDPLGVGGANEGRAGDAPAVSNPVAYLLSMEGALTFAASATRRLGSQRSKASAPFTVNAQAAGYGSAATGEDAKGELWAPLWRNFVSLAEWRALLAEGRATWNGAQARDATDFLRAVRTLGVTRGIDAFERFGFLVRNGQSPVAVPVGRVGVRDEGAVRLTAELDRWLAQLNRGDDKNVPAAVRVARRNVQGTLFRASDRPGADAFRRLLVTVAAAERAVRRSGSFRRSSGIGPVPLLSRGWVDALDDGSPEFGVAALLAAGEDRSVDRFRSMGEILRGVARVGGALSFLPAGPEVDGLGTRPVAEVLAEVAIVRCRLANPIDDELAPVRGVRPRFSVAVPKESTDPGAPSEVAEAFLAAAFDDVRIDEWLQALTLLGPGAFSEHGWGMRRQRLTRPYPSPVWRLLAPWFASLAVRLDMPRPGPILTPVVPSTWANRIHTGDVSQLRSVAAEAVRMYRISLGKPTANASDLLIHGGPGADRLLAALLVPVSLADTARLVRMQVDLDLGEQTVTNSEDPTPEGAQP